MCRRLGGLPEKPPIVTGNVVLLLQLDTRLAKSEQIAFSRRGRLINSTVGVNAERVRSGAIIKGSFTE
jgi:hypothetical protein